MKTGIGTFKFNNGQEYQGKWFEDKKHGQGKYIWKAEGKLVGVFDNDYLKHGVLTKKDGTKMELKA